MVVPIFHTFPGNDEHTGLQFLNLYLPLPAKAANLLIPAAGVHLEQSHLSPHYRRYFLSSLRLPTPVSSVIPDSPLLKKWKGLDESS